MSHFRNVTIDGKRYNILWNGLYASHIADETAENPHNHPYSFLRIQDFLSRSKMVFDQGSNKVAFNDRPENENSIIVIPCIIGKGYIIPKSCYIASRDLLQKFQRKTGIKGIEDFWSQESVDKFYEMQADGMIFDAEKVMNGIAKRILTRK